MNIIPPIIPGDWHGEAKRFAISIKEIFEQLSVRKTTEADLDKGLREKLRSIGDIAGIKEALAGKANRDEIPDISNLATRREIPDISGLASKTEVGAITKWKEARIFCTFTSAGNVDTTITFTDGVPASYTHGVVIITGWTPSADWNTRIISKQHVYASSGKPYIGIRIQGGTTQTYTVRASFWYY